MQLDEAARRCEEAAEHLAQAPPKARSGAEATTLRGAGGYRQPAPDREPRQRSGGYGWVQLTPVTYDADEAREWFEVLPAAMGVEGLVLKPTAARYAGGSRSSWEG